jgi:YbbR domain-containing protein
MKAPFTNIWLRIIAIVMGLLLWFHVATEKVYNYEVRLPITEIILKDNLALASETPESLSVKVSANGKHLLRQDWKKAGLRINASQYVAGMYNLELTTSNVLLAHAGIISLDEVVQPSNFFLHVDYLDMARIKVSPNLIVTPDEGYAVKAVLRPVPSEVVLRGARSLLEQIGEVTTELKEVSGLRNNVEMKLAVIPPPGQGISLDPDSVRVEIEVVPVKTRLFEKIPIIVYNSPTGKKVLPQPPTIDIEMTGPPDEINLLNRNALIASVDYDQLTSTDSAPIKIDCPGRFKVKKSSAQFVQLTEN